MKTLLRGWVVMNWECCSPSPVSLRAILVFAVIADQVEDGGLQKIDRAVLLSHAAFGSDSCRAALFAGVRRATLRRLAVSRFWA